MNLLDSTYGDLDPVLSRDGLRLYFRSNRTAGFFMFLACLVVGNA